MQNPSIPYRELTPHPVFKRGPITGTRHMDMLYLAAGIGFFAVMAGYARWAAKA
jgi:hypothetical protein